MIKHKYDRFKSAPWYGSTDETIVVGGAGGIGSWVCMLLSRAGFDVAVYDFDIVEEHNLGGQLFGVNDIGSSKVDALNKIVRLLCDSELSVFNRKFEDKSTISSLCIAAFDNNASRYTMYNSWRSHYSGDPNALFISPSLTAEQMFIYCIEGTDTEAMLEFEREGLTPSSELSATPCTFKQTSHAAAMIASHIVGFVTNHLTNISVGEKEREVPFYWEYFIPTNTVSDRLVVSKQ